MARTNDLATQLITTALEANLRITTAESCTGGLLGAALTDVSGSSAVFYGGFQTYANEAKVNMLDVPADLLNNHGAVSKQVAASMAIGALNKSNEEADMALSITGIAGPSGGTLEKPVGLVWFGVKLSGKDVQTDQQVFKEVDRAAIRSAAVDHALTLLLAACTQISS